MGEGERSDAAEGEAAPVASATTPTSDTTADGSWAQRHPWWLAIVTGLIVAALVGGYSWIRAQHENIAIGRSGSIGSFTYTLQAFECDDIAPSDRPYEGDGDAEAPDMQECSASFSVRNNGNSAGGPGHEMILYVGDHRYEARRSLLGAGIFPDQAVSVDVTFRIPLGVDPTRLRITPGPGRGAFLDSVVPFYNEWITYDLG